MTLPLTIEGLEELEIEVLARNIQEDMTAAAREQWGDAVEDTWLVAWKELPEEARNVLRGTARRLLRRHPR